MSAPYVTCYLCKRDRLRVRKDGRLPKHRLVRAYTWQRGKRPVCAASGERP